MQATWSITLAERLKYRNVALKLLLSEANLEQPRLQVPPIPAVKRNLANVQAIEQFAQMLRDVFVVDCRAGRGLDLPSRCQTSYGTRSARARSRRLSPGSQKVGLTFHSVPPSAPPGAIKTSAVRSDTSDKVKAAEHRQASEVVRDRRAACFPYGRRHERSRRVDALVEEQPAEARLLRRHACRIAALSSTSFVERNIPSAGLAAAQALPVEHVAIGRCRVDVANNARVFRRLRVVDPARKHIVVCRRLRRDGKQHRLAFVGTLRRLNGLDESVGRPFDLANLVQNRQDGRAAVRTGASAEMALYSTFRDRPMIVLPDGMTRASLTVLATAKSSWTRS
jgi:hypothetical protein